jgi:hypothetical protein
VVTEVSIFAVIARATKKKKTPHFGCDEFPSPSLRMICAEDMGQGIPNRVLDNDERARMTGSIGIMCYSVTEQELDNDFVAPA